VDPWVVEMDKKRRKSEAPCAGHNHTLAVIANEIRTRQGVPISSNPGKRAEGVSASFYNNEEIQTGLQEGRKGLWLETDRAHSFNEAAEGLYPQNI
jgi:hypothetical protein